MVHVWVSTVFFLACSGGQYHRTCYRGKNKAPDTFPVVAPPQRLGAKCQWPLLASCGCWLWRLSSETGATCESGGKLGKRSPGTVVDISVGRTIAGTSAVAKIHHMCRRVYSSTCAHAEWWREGRLWQLPPLPAALDGTEAGLELAGHWEGSEASERDSRRPAAQWCLSCVHAQTRFSCKKLRNILADWSECGRRRRFRPQQFAQRKCASSGLSTWRHPNHLGALNTTIALPQSGRRLPTLHKKLRLQHLTEGAELQNDHVAYAVGIDNLPTVRSPCSWPTTATHAVMRSILIDDWIMKTPNRHGNWLRVALDSWRISLYQLVGQPAKCKPPTLAASPAVLPQFFHKWTPLRRALRRGLRSCFQEKRVCAWIQDKHHCAAWKPKRSYRIHNRICETRANGSHVFLIRAYTEHQKWRTTDRPEANQQCIIVFWKKKLTSMQQSAENVSVANKKNGIVLSTPTLCWTTCMATAWQWPTPEENIRHAAQPMLLYHGTQMLWAESFSYVSRYVQCHEQRLLADKRKPLRETNDSGSERWHSVRGLHAYVWRQIRLPWPAPAGEKSR